MNDALNRLIQDVESEPDFTKATRMVAARVSMILGVDVCSLYLRDPTSGLFNMVANEGFYSAVTDNVKFEVGEGLVGLVAERAEPLNLVDASTHPQTVVVDELVENVKTVFLGSPVVHNRRVIGVVTVRRDSDRFTDDEESFLGVLTNRLSPIVAHATASVDFTFEGAVTDSDRDLRFEGIPGSPGIGIGETVLIHPPVDINLVPERIAENPNSELARFDDAIAHVRSDMERYNKAFDLAEEERLIFDAYVHVLDDEAMGGEVRQEIQHNRQWAQGAVKRVFRQHIDKLSAADNQYLAARSEDLKHIGQQIIARLQDFDSYSQDSYPNETILISDEVTASMIAEVPRERLKGIVSIRGSANSHTAILARALDVPAVMCADLPIYNSHRKFAIVDGNNGEVVIGPSNELLMDYDRLISEEEDFAEELEELKDQPAVTLDDLRVNLWANIGLVSEITQSLDRGAEGIGLFRTEIPFANSVGFPTEARQYEIYRRHMVAFDPKPVTMRMLDIGGDKQLPYFAIEEDNPFLGWRGIRITLDRPDIFLVQVRAMIKASEGLRSTLRVMLPMVTNLEEVTFAKDLIDRAYKEVQEEGFAVSKPLVGVMIEVPALIYQVRLLARSVDFLAVGSNDLTQYLLAVSRNNPRVASLYQEFHPAVLRVLRELAKTANTENIGIGICGELAGTVEGALLCIGMGYHVLSMNTINLPRVKWAIRQVSTLFCRRLLARVLRMDDVSEITAFLESSLTEAGLERGLTHRESIMSTRYA